MERMRRERETMHAMIQIYCKDKHGQDEICSACQAFEDFAFIRLEKCPFQEKKPACQNCKVHCYQSNIEMRQKAKEIMGYAGPRMLLKYPYFAIMHIFDKFRKAPTLQELKKMKAKK